MQDADRLLDIAAQALNEAAKSKGPTPRFGGLWLDGFAEISATVAIESIQRSKRVPFSSVLLGLNIFGIGWVLAQNLAVYGSYFEISRKRAATRLPSRTETSSSTTSATRAPFPSTSLSLRRTVDNRATGTSSALRT